MAQKLAFCYGGRAGGAPQNDFAPYKIFKNNEENNRNNSLLF